MKSTFSTPQVNVSRTKLDCLKSCAYMEISRDELRMLESRAHFNTCDKGLHSFHLFYIGIRRNVSETKSCEDSA